ncbi:MAG: hypothetical protein JWQ17_3073 [Tardiphaga sp.]|nr:hypothetical protein [Tardiphaga sp.]
MRRSVIAAPCMQRRWVMAAIVLFATAMPAMAETFDAVYRATLAGVPVGKGRLTGDVGTGAYTIRLKGEASLLGFSSRFEAASNGASSGTRRVPANYLLKTEGRVARKIEVNFAGDGAANVSIEPQPSAADREGRLPIEPAHLKEALDPMSAMMTEILRASQSDNPCDGIAHVFTGSMRFDLTLTSGEPAIGEIVCRAVYHPIAGHKPSGSSKPIVALIAYPRVGKAGEPRLPVRLEVPLPVGTITIRRIG